MNTLLKILLFFLIFSNISLFAERPLIYNFQLNTRLGYHLFSQKDTWTKLTKESLSNEMFFRNETDFYSKNVDVNNVNQPAGMPILSIEGLWGIHLDKIPGLKKIDALKKFQGFRAGFSMTFYPFSAVNRYNYSGPMVFQNPNASETILQEK